MRLTNEEFVSIIENSSFLHERRQPEFEVANVSDAEAVATRLTKWKRIAAVNEDDLFARRLEFDGLTPETAASLLAGVRLRNAASALPAWTEFLQGGLDVSEGYALLTPEELTESRAFLDPADALAFEHVLAGFVEFAANRLRERAAAFLDLLDQSAWTRLERNLAQWLAAVSAETIHLEFSVYRTLNAVQDAGAYISFGSFPVRTLYTPFVREMWTSRLVAFLKEYTVLARLIGTVALLWVENTLEFVRHLHEDRSAIESTFSPNGQLGPITKLEPGLSDRHRGGTTSFRVQFENGLELIYKPKSLESEELYYGLLRWLNGRHTGLDLAVFRAVYRADHGWVEVTPHLPCADIEAVHRYYNRAGKLLSLMYCLEANDCHHENIIASGEYPALIDMETLLQHRVAMIETSGQEDASAAANRVFYWDSVFRTALLPRWEFGPNGESYDISGLGGVEEHVTPFKRKAWQHINTDAMKLKREPIKTRPSGNLVRCQDQKMNPAEFVDDIAGGFTEMYRLLADSREDLFAPAGPLHAMRNLHIRFLYRHTKIYSTVLNSILLPDYLRNGADTSIQVDILSRPLLHTQEPHPFWPIVAVEEAAILRADIPIFTASANDTALIMENAQTIPRFFAEPSYVLLEKRFDQLGDEDLRVQLSYIRTCFHTPASVAPEAPRPFSTPDAPVSAQEFADEALRIAHQICEAAIQSSDGSATWITLAYYSEAQRWQLQPMTPRLYDGACGPVLLLAAAARLSGDSKLRELAQSGIRSITAALSSSATVRVLNETGIGAGLGTASLPYSLVQAALLLDQKDLLDEAHHSADILTTERINEDRRLDLLGGAAGALVALLTLHQYQPEPTLLAKAKLCGEHLLAHQIQEGATKGAWPTLSGSPLTGMSHGAAGIAYALARLFAATGDKKWLDAALNGCEYESTLYLPEQHNWPDLRYPKSANGYVIQNSWCHGAPGITLARLAGLPWMDNEMIRTDIERGLDAITEQPFGDLDHLCCGNLGRAETILVAGERLGRGDLTERARQLGTQVLLRARALGQYRLGLNDAPYLPSFHQGMAGVAYQFLRLAYPDQFSSVLLWGTAA